MTLAWVLVFLGAVAWFAALWFWVRRPLWLRLWLGLLIPVWSLMASPVEGFPGEFAPAIIVALYETFFAVEGNPGTAIALLVIGTLLLSIGVPLALLGVQLLQRRGISVLALLAKRKRADKRDDACC